MPKTIFSAGQKRLLKLLRDEREKAGLTQVELAKKLGVPQSFAVFSLLAGVGVVFFSGRQKNDRGNAW